MPKHAKPILDLETRREYSSMYKAGQELATLVGGDPKNRLVWFAVQRAFPNRFQTKDLETGKWIALAAPPRTTRARKTVDEHSAPDGAPLPGKSDARDEVPTAKAGTAPIATRRTVPASKKAPKAPTSTRKSKPNPKKQSHSPRKATRQAVR